METLLPQDFPLLLKEITDPPKKLYLRGVLPSPTLKLLAVVGSRALSSYGKEVTKNLIAGLKGYPIGIVSGLALGTDALAHEAALTANLYTLAIPGSGLDWQ
jgi:DNA processing protein